MTNSVSKTLLQQAGVDDRKPLAAADALIAQGQVEAAQTLLEDLVKQSPGRPDAWFGLGQVKSLRGDVKGAIKAFSRAVQLSPDVVDGHVHLGNAYLRNGRVSQAIDAYNHGLKYLSRHPLLYFNLGVALRQSGDISGAIAAYKTAIALHPTYPQAYFSLGNAYRDNKQPQQAETAYRKAIEIDPRFVDAQANLAGLLAAEKNYDEAIKTGFATLALAPDHIHALRNLSLSLYKAGRYSEGTEITFRALQVAPDDVMLHYHMGEMLYGLIRTGESDKARSHAQRWRSGYGTHPVAQHMAAAILGDDAPQRAGDVYVRETFDRFANDFESVLTGLGYRVPELLCTAARDLLGDRTGLTVLDAGCGTGLCAPYLRPMAKKLVGVDLSGGMLEKARARNLYDSLEEAELGAFLAQTADSYDLTIAADVFCYFGALDAAFRDIAGKTPAGGLFGFTVEAMQEQGASQPYRLGPTGRYQHDRAYVRSCLEQAGYEVLRFDDTHGRVEMGQPVPCFMVLARRN